MLANLNDGPSSLDFFCGFGGSSSGLREAGFRLVSAYNHWQTAIDVHGANFPEADHVQGDLSGYDMRRLPRADVLWASPECTWHSPAGGRKRARAADLDLFDDPVPTDAGVRSRATMWDPLRAAEARQFKAVMIENVPEVAGWPLFEVWLKAWEALGYTWQIINASAAHISGPGNAPAGHWRDRIYIVFAAKGVTIPPIEPRPLAWCEQCGAAAESVQTWKKNHGPIRVGKYRRQYVYTCSSVAHPRHIVEPYVLPAAAVIDWSDLGTPIRDRPLKEYWADKAKTVSLGWHHIAPATKRRVEIGARMFAEPAVVAHTGETWDAASPSHPRYGEPDAYYRAWPTGSAPLMARHGSGGDAISVPPFMTAVNHDGDARAQRLADGPLPTRSTKIGDGLVFPPFIAELYGTSTVRDVNQPLSSVTAGGNHHGLTFPPGAFLSKHHGGLDYRRPEHMNKSPREPLAAIVSAPTLFDLLDLEAS